MSNHALVIVESPAKAKKINDYLGKDYTVLASYGHVRDLPSKDGSVLPDDDFSMQWAVSDKATKALKEIRDAMKKSDRIILATDPDREGEAISWHIRDYLNEKKLVKDKPITRVTFNEITKKAVLEAFDQPRELDQDLIDAYLARRALDYLVGFTISPILWRKLPGSRSAGRVQSVALRLICEREAEIEIFQPQEYWSVEAKLHTPSGAPFIARLTHLAGNKLDKFDLNNEKLAREAAARIESKTLSVTALEKKQARRNPAAPFITSTMQQEASRKLGMGASATMQTAQRLYEAGLITYMRTDGITLSGDAVADIRAQIASDFDQSYVPSSPRMYKSKAKNAQEAHEAIRPTEMAKTPKKLGSQLNGAERDLYELIWKRTMACQMEAAILDQVAADISDGTDDVVLRATGSVVAFDGFLALYKESKDEDSDSKDDKDRRLPPMDKGDATPLSLVTPDQHFTQPPPRYTEASLVKKLEEEGIGRPSTYAAILQVLQDRNYVRLDAKRFIPEDRGRIVTTFLMKYFTRYVDVGFTAEMEEELDAISAGHVAWKEALRLFWQEFTQAVEATKDLTITQVIDVLNEELAPHFFPARSDGKDPRACPSCDDGVIGLKLGKFGAFLGCSNYPDCKHTAQLEIKSEGDGEALDLSEPKLLGKDPETDMDISLRKGPYGVYVQLGPHDPEDKKPKRQGLPKGTNPQDITLDDALSLLALPRDVGEHPETKKMIQAGIGRFGPYVKHEKDFRSLKAGDDVLTIGMNRAMELLSAPKGGGRAAATPLKTLGKHPESDDEIALYSGRYGPYVKCGKVNATLKKDMDPDSVTLEQAIELVNAKGGATKKKAAPKKKKAAAKKAGTKKTATKKPAAKKKPATKKAAQSQS